MIRLSARREWKQIGNGSSQQATIYTIRASVAPVFETEDAGEAASHLARLGVDEPDRFVEQVKLWRELEIKDS